MTDFWNRIERFQPNAVFFECEDMNVRIERPKYLDWLMKARNNGRIKVITGIRRSGKSYLLNEIFRANLLESGMLNDHIIFIDLDKKNNRELLNPLKLEEFINNSITDDQKYTVILDEIQKVYCIMDPIFTDGKIKLAKPGDPGTIWFPEVVLGFLGIPNVDIYITGSNSKFLSSDIATELRDRYDEIHILPVSLQELMQNKTESDWKQTLDNYFQFGGMPYCLTLETKEQKENYLASLLERTYTADLVERYRIRSREALMTLSSVLAGSLGSQVNPKKISDTFRSQHYKSIDEDTIRFYLLAMQEAFLVEKSSRYDIKGRKEIGALAKYYFADPGLFHAADAFRSADRGHVFENIVFNELIYMGFNVQTGILNYRETDESGTQVRKTAEIDFAATKFNRTVYIQAAWSVADPQVLERERAPLRKIKSPCRKIIVTMDDNITNMDEFGIEYLTLKEFLSKDL